VIIGATTFSIMTLNITAICIMTCVDSKMTLLMMSLSLMAPSTMGSMHNDSKHNDIKYNYEMTLHIMSLA
jgi:hypothetical protein